MMSSHSLCSYRSRESVVLSRYSSKENIRSPEELNYTLGKTIGSGTYAKVKAAWCPYERKMIAIKIIEKRGASEEFLTKFLPREMHALQELSHPNVLRVFRLVETPQQVYFMLEIAQNGDLLDYINMSKAIPEPEARFVMRSISAGIAHCHSRDIVHRDLKCENIMITKEMNIKIGDFGFARKVDAECSGVTTPCGSFSYAAPELFSGTPGSTYDGKKADIWSMGCILYAMVCGRLPFGDDSQVAKMMSKPLNFPVTLTEECKHLLAFGLLNTDVEMRCNIIQLRISHWMRGVASPLTPYQYPMHMIDECLPKVLLDPLYAVDATYLPSPSPTSRPSVPVNLLQPTQHSSFHSAPAPSTGQEHTATATATSSCSGAPSKKKEVHRRKKTAVAHLEQRLRVLNDPTNTVILPSPMPEQVRPASIKGKISSAGKKLVSAFLGH